MLNMNKAKLLYKAMEKISLQEEHLESENPKF